MAVNLLGVDIMPVDAIYHFYLLPIFLIQCSKGRL